MISNAAIGGFVLFILLLVVVAAIIIIIVHGEKTNLNLAPDNGGFTGTTGQTAGLRIVNNCSMDAWLQVSGSDATTPVPGLTGTRIFTPQGTIIDYNPPSGGFSSFRTWFKYGCDSSGMNCEVGDSVPYFPETDVVPPGGFQIPANSLFEATFGCSGCSGSQGQTFFDTSNVDGFTYPYMLIVKPVIGTSGLASCDSGIQGASGIINGGTLDTSNRQFVVNNLTNNGANPTAFSNTMGTTVELTAVDLAFTGSTGQILGWYSPCQQLAGVYAVPATVSDPYCCNGLYNTAPTCNAGPVNNTNYVTYVENQTDNLVYASAFSDAQGNHNCSVGSVMYEFVACPPGSASYFGS